ncbi:unnamed protein product [Clonostachys rhizophaga]|uniref:U1-type domain-containing protein n=1 Tax=Clonostachys rhizophaga TaxID=160324 RepID=A0A9N9V4I1_9HYPO|nr:unnamed protein product [Clonostachys rhizophaga]
MAEHWKSTPKYWCKHCSVFVRDTKFERQNHEATAKHQYALKRFLRDLHRDHEKEEREKERARREIARLDGVVSGASSSSRPGPRGSSQAGPVSAGSTEAELKKQREQLAELGVAMPDDFRLEMAMAGEWTVTSTRVIEDKPAEGEDSKDTKATGVRKREVTEEEKEEEEALQSLFKKPRRWGRDSKTVGNQDEDADLDALLSGSILTHQNQNAGGDLNVKAEDEAPEFKEEVKKEEPDPVKKEPDTEVQGLTMPDDTAEPKLEPQVKKEYGETGPAPIVFKKRKPKTVRQK